MCEGKKQRCDKQTATHNNNHIITIERLDIILEEKSYDAYRNHRDEDVGFILCQIKLLQINNSEIAPMFEVLEQPNNWAKEMKKPVSERHVTKLPKIRDMLQWEAVTPGDVLIAKDSNAEAILLDNGHVEYDGEEMSMQVWLRKIYNWKSVETYKFAIHKKTGKTLSQIRREYMEKMESDQED